MERKIIVASHGGAAAGLVDSVKMILGEIKSEVEIFSLLPGMNTNDYSNKLSLEMEANPEREYVILSDLYGASVCTAMFSLLSHKHVWLFTGMNLNMLLSVCIEYPRELSAEDAQKIVADSRQGVQWVTNEIEENEDF